MEDNLASVASLRPDRLPAGISDRLRRNRQFREPFRTYRRQQVRSRLAKDNDYARRRNPQGFTKGDVERLVDEIRAGLHAAGSGRKGSYGS